MTRNTEFFLNSRRAFYTVEAAIFLPLVILAVLTLGFFLKADACWENCMNGALDECSYSAATASSGTAGAAAASRVRKRLGENVPLLENLSVKSGNETCSLSASISLPLPLGFERAFDIKGRIKYRDFIGLKYNRESLGTEGLETDVNSNAVWIFPLSGTRYHKENCTYVKASVNSCILTNALKGEYSPCSMCDSGSMSNGSMVFCFGGEDTSYHRGSCRCINRHTIVIDKSEAKKKGYSPCSKCGG